MNEPKGDKFVLLVCVFIAGWLAGTWMTPEPRFAACIEIPKKVQAYPQSKAEVRRFINYYRRDL